MSFGKKNYYAEQNQKSLVSSKENNVPEDREGFNKPALSKNEEAKNNKKGKRCLYEIYRS